MPDNDHDAAPTEDPSSGDPTTTDSEIDAAARWDELAGRYHFERCCSAALAIVRQAWERHTRGADDADDTLGDPSAEEVATALDHGSVAPILVDFVLDDADAGSPALGAFADALIERTTTPHTGAHLVRALNAEADGRVLEAEADFEASLAADPDYVPVIYELARFASDRGDIDRAVALYRRVGSGAQPEVDFLSGLLPDWSKVGRNDPCPCGSGRKFKQCHLDRPEVPAERAALWLFQKLLGFTYRHQFAAIRSDLARAALTGAMSNDEVVLVDDRALHANAVYQRFLDEPFLLDLAVFDCGIVERFAAERAVLLPPAETEMLHDWMAAERRLWEITGVEPDHHIVLRDVVSDATVEVAEQVASRSVETGDLLLALVVPVRGEMQLIGQPVSVKPPQRQTARDQVEQQVDALTWATWFGQLHARATSQNLDDEDLIAGAAVVRPSARIDVGALLDEHYQPGDTAGRWTDGLDVDGRRIVRAHLDLEDDGRIIVTANSDVRMDRVLDRLRAADPGLVIEGDERRPFDEQQLAALLARTPD